MTDTSVPWSSAVIWIPVVSTGCALASTNLESGVEQGADGVLEADGGPQVAVPVGAVQFGVGEVASGHRGEERYPRGPRHHVGCRLLDLGPDVLDLGAVGGVVDGDAAGPDAAALAVRQQGVERVGAAGDHRGGGAVHGGDRELSVVLGPGVAGEESFHLGQGPVHGDHAAVAGEFRGDRPTAQRHHPRTILQTHAPATTAAAISPCE
ncbi:hypothetical protein IHE61_22030 [Streptomyces sp. GKU 257-1]|nr:hypothetical protein [Streptomyces sp. GKU 257-1]